MQLTITNFSRKIKEYINLVHYRGERISITRGGGVVAFLVPAAPRLTAIEAMADLYRTLPEDAAENWLEDSRDQPFIDKYSDKHRDAWES